MAEGTRVSHLAESLTKLREESKAESVRVSQLAEALDKLREDSKEFQTKTDASLSAILDKLTMLAPGYVHPIRNENHTQGETSGEKSTDNPPFPEGGGGIHARSVKLDFPKFDGTDPTDWILKAQQFFSFGQIQDNQRVPIASFHMEGRALQWYNWLMESGPIGSWEEFVVALKVRFAPSAFDDPIGAFTKLQQTSTVDEYQSQFEILSNRITGLSEDFRVSTFLSGLKEEVRITVTMLKPTSLPAAFGLARLQEQEVLRRSRAPKDPPWPSNPLSYQSNGSTYPKLAAPITPPTTPLTNFSEIRNTSIIQPSYNPNTFNRKPSLPIRRISQSQMQERRERGLCYYCDDKYQPGHRCNRPKLYLLRGMELEEKGEGVEEEVALETQVNGAAAEGELLGIFQEARP